jgi:hypothetical protein
MKTVKLLEREEEVFHNSKHRGYIQNADEPGSAEGQIEMNFNFHIRVFVSNFRALSAS